MRQNTERRIHENYPFLVWDAAAYKVDILGLSSVYRGKNSLETVYLYLASTAESEGWGCIE